MSTLPASDTLLSTTIEIPGLTVAALRSNAGKPVRVLAVHGWLDNANSFVPMAALLPNVDLVAIDLPGHGHSSHIGPGAHYHFMDIMNWVVSIADALGWQDFHYLGHSLGGCIAPFVAAAIPQSVTSVIMVEASGPLTETSDKILDRLQRSAQDQLNYYRYKTRCFDTIEQATNARLLATTMTRPAAQLIVERQLKKTPDGYTWRYDQRHRSTSAIYLTEDQVMAALSAVACPVLAVTAAEGYLTGRTQTASRMAQLAQLTRHEVAGNHHMHMDNPIPTAEHINAFLSV